MAELGGSGLVHNLVASFAAPNREQRTPTPTPTPTATRTTLSTPERSRAAIPLLVASVRQVDELADELGDDVQRLRDEMHSANFVVLLHIHTQLLTYQADLNRTFQSTDTMVGDIGIELDVLKNNLVGFSSKAGKGKNQMPAWRKLLPGLDKAMKNMKFVAGTSASRPGHFEYTVKTTDGDAKTFHLSAGKHKNAKTWQAEIEKTVHRCDVRLSCTVKADDVVAFRFTDSLFKQIDIYFPEETLHWSNLFRIFDAATVPADMKDWTDDHDAMITELGSCTGRRTSRGA